MRLSFFLLASTMVSAGFGQTLTVATFNAEFLYPSKVHLKYGLEYRMSDNTPDQQQEWEQPGFRMQKYEEAVVRVAELLAQIETDVLTLSEVGDEDELSFLVEALHDQGVEYEHVAVCSCSDPTGQHVAVLSKLPFLDDGIIHSLTGREGYELEEDDPDEQKDTGVSKGMSVKVLVDGDPVNIFVVHLASERGGHEQDRQRIAQASIVRRLVIPMLNEGEHVIVTGDMNDQRGSPTLRRLRGLDDIWPDLLQTGHWQFFKEGEEASRWTYEFRGELNQIDHILVSYSLRRTQTSSIRTRVIEVPQQTAPRISDHRPIVVTMELP